MAPTQWERLVMKGGRIPDHILFRLLLLLTVAAIVPDLAAGQGIPNGKEPGPVLVQLEYLKTELLSRRSDTCIAVLPDGHFHLEKKWRLSVTVGWGLQIFEGTLSDEALRSLTTILAMDDLKKLKAADELRPGTAEAEMVKAVIPRPDGLQDISLVALGFLPEQHPRPLPAAVGPLIQWIRMTSKEIGKHKGSLLKSRKATNCWLPKPPEF
jgi:hypothetical protein